MRRLLALLALLACLACLAAPGAGASTGTPVFEGPARTAAVTEDRQCLACAFFDSLVGVAERVVGKVGAAVGPSAAGLLGSLLLFGFVWYGGRLMTTMDFTHLKTAFAIAAGGACAAILLHDHTLYRDWIHLPLQNIALDFAVAVLSVSDVGVGKPTSPPLLNGYTELIWLAEEQIWRIIKLVITIFKKGGADIAHYVLSGTLLLPYLFVAGIFIAFMVECAFKFYSIGILAPVLTMLLPFRSTRAGAIAALRTLIGAGLTVIFASGAMALTVGIVDKYVGVVDKQLQSREQYEAACAKVANPAYDVQSDEMGEMWYHGGSVAALKCEKPYTHFTIYTKDFFIFYIVGFVSVLLHLGSKSLASNISGANDGVGPAAATVAAAKLGLVYAASAGGNVLSQARSRMFHGGVAGASAAGVQKIIDNMTGFDAGNQPGGGPPLDRTSTQFSSNSWSPVSDGRNRTGSQP